MEKKNIAIVGGGPAGLMAAEVLATSGCAVSIYDRMPSLGRKFLMAGRGGLNLTHSEPLENFIKRYGPASDWISNYIRSFSPDDLRIWCEGLGQETFIGSSGRVFPRNMKAAPLLRSWFKRLEELGVSFHSRHTWQGWVGEALQFADANGKIVLVKPDATLLALGGASWPRLGSDGSWVNILSKEGIEISELRPTNCGFIVPWSEYFSTNYAGMPLKSVAVTHKGISHAGEIMITQKGLEGGAIYAISAHLRESIAAEGNALLHIDLYPNISLDALTKKLKSPRGKQSLSTYLRKAGFPPVAIALLREVTPPEVLAGFTAETLATRFKSLPVTFTKVTDIARAISTAGGIKLSALDKFMLRAKPGVFVAGEMLDWEAPTGGYLLQGCFSSAVAAANQMLSYCTNKN
jgi:uncharacterized flavoprotein (TIGR03862 family)